MHTTIPDSPFSKNGFPGAETPTMSPAKLSYHKHIVHSNAFYPNAGDMGTPVDRAHTYSIHAQRKFEPIYSIFANPARKVDDAA